MSEWIKWNGGELPVDEEVEVQVRCRDGYEDYGLAGNFMQPHNTSNWWSHTCMEDIGDDDPRDKDIIEYRIIDNKED